MKLNGLLASPAFAAWGDGAALDIESMLHTADGAAPGGQSSRSPTSATRSVSSSSPSSCPSWSPGCAAQSGSPDLRAMVYMDEVFGFVPPTAAPPAKRPILTILKQARAFGVGMVLSTQNPVDLDYKAISNAGTWMIGRLQTERDRDRLLDGMRSAGGTVDIAELADTIGNLGKREFVFHSTRGGGVPTRFGTRWAMSYSARPADSRADQCAHGRSAPDRAPDRVHRRRAVAVEANPSRRSAPDPDEPAPPALADDESAVAPEVADNVAVSHLDPAAPWAASVRRPQPAEPGLVPALAARVRLLFDETKGDLRHEAEWEAVVAPLGADVDGADFVAVDYDDRDLRARSHPTARCTCCPRPRSTPRRSSPTPSGPSRITCTAPRPSTSGATTS